jgi:hypothetical protein
MTKRKSEIREEEDNKISKKIKLTARYFIMTVTEDGNSGYYEINTSHNLFPIVIKAFKENEIKEEDDYPNNEAALFSIMTDGLIGDSDNKFICDEETKKTLSNFLEIDFEESEFNGFLKSEFEYMSKELRKLLIEGHVLYMASFC